MWYFPYFTDEETKAQRSNLSKVTHLVTKPEFQQYHKVTKNVNKLRHSCHHGHLAKHTKFMRDMI